MDNVVNIYMRKQDIIKLSNIIIATATLAYNLTSVTHSNDDIKNNQGQIFCPSCFVADLHVPSNQSTADNEYQR